MRRWRGYGVETSLPESALPYCCGRQTRGPVVGFVCTVCGAEWRKERIDTPHTILDEAMALGPRAAEEVKADLRARMNRAIWREIGVVQDIRDAARDAARDTETGSMHG